MDGEPEGEVGGLIKFILPLVAPCSHSPHHAGTMLQRAGKRRDETMRNSSRFSYESCIKFRLQYSPSLACEGSISDEYENGVSVVKKKRVMKKERSTAKGDLPAVCNVCMQEMT